MKIAPATKEMEDVILKEVKYSRKQLTTDLQILKDWMKEQKHLPEVRMEEPDDYLLLYLVGAKGSLETAKRKIDAYYTFRSVSPIFQQRDNIELLKQAAKSQWLLALPEPLPDGCVAMMFGVRDTDINVFDQVNVTRRVFVMEDYLFRNSGIVQAQYLLVDAAGFTSAHTLRTSPTLLRSTLAFIQEALPLSLKKVIVFNAPAYVESLVNNFVRPFLKGKLRERVIVSSESIEKIFDYPEHLPEDYGGKYQPAEKLAEKWEQAIMNWNFLPKLEERVDESLRTRKAGEYDSYFGLHGSIKALVID